STLLQTELTAGGQAISDNLCVSDGRTAWGLLEPMRLAGGGAGRSMPHGRHEEPLEGRLPDLAPDRVVVVRRGTGAYPALCACASDGAARSLVTGTYMAGELRRYWAFAATLAAATGLGPAHPDV